ncbi:hypothetical protein UFOVP964_95 [uncultured Caudovirales phage]|uniref:Uncharacterized protein n=1 Tax=uncultured Caudovirales phage TaxID=2100421 RepID=A0A6J5Q0D6_9CAUD|nr:hypothetical protein UFOVP854_95 [uncultured Caudovirales phage]CAB4174875.1 hypothetical protein UFOVP964_95 [uncultured Caudovirales phage]CAB4179306.1 hypothetical protein UFOVP1034_63 [uncultured Caudovirales phage]CAB4189107.1 hypothetical protein UFOVP1177_63 [uncultured Caudovirales phage]CAB4193269.1 hypothetical protein UFOVP1243_50 [uncultured Caudovirales phage]
MATVAQAIEALSKYDPNEDMLVIYWDKELGREWANSELEELQVNYELTDEQITEIFNGIWKAITDDSYDTEDVGERINNAITEEISDWVKEKEEAKEDVNLWDKEIPNESI